MNLKAVVLGTLLSLSANAQAPEKYELGNQPYIFSINNPTTNTTALFVCHTITPVQESK